MKILIRILLLCIVLAAGVLGYAALKDPHHHISREIVIKAPPQKIFPYINDAKLMNSWNPWMKLDPKMNITFSGPPAGVGAKTSWAGDKRIGAGSATIIESIENLLVRTHLEYTDPHPMSQIAEISLTPQSDGTLVRWSVSGDTLFLGRIFCIFMNLDKMIGGTFDEGLKTLKEMIEQG